MTGGPVFTSRLRGRPLLDSEGLTIGRIRDVVILPAAGNDPPRALGLVVTLHRRRRATGMWVARSRSSAATRRHRRAAAGRHNKKQPPRR